MEKKKIEVDIKVPNQTRYLSLIGRIGEDIAKELDKFDGDRETLAYHLNLVLTEAMANAIKYAYAGDPETMVHICISISADEVLIKVFDNGQGFDINAIPLRCDAVEWAFASAAERPPGRCHFPALTSSMEPGAVIDRWLQARIEGTGGEG